LILFAAAQFCKIGHQHVSGSEQSMARYKDIDTNPRFIAVDLRQQLRPGACREQVTFIALSGDSAPHFTTIAAFVSSKKASALRVCSAMQPSFALG
jgi:hypothetical protein